MGLVRSLGREGIPVVLGRESRQVFERKSKYSREFVLIPGFDSKPDKTLELLTEIGQNYNEKPVVFFNGESDVLFFSKYRDRLSQYYNIVLADDEMIKDLLNKDRFSILSDKFSLPTPKTFIINTKNEFKKYVPETGFPFVIKPVKQRLWHQPNILEAIGLHKALLINNQNELDSFLLRYPDETFDLLLQQYIPGTDSDHYDLHTYIDKSGNEKGTVLGRKIRTYPVHFGIGCYTHYEDLQEVNELCIDALNKINYRGVANINLKKHSQTGEFYIFEVNPRFSIWTIIDTACGVNLPMQAYNDALDIPTENLIPHGKPQRWLYFNSDFKAMIGYRKYGELTIWGWVKSYFSYKGKIEFHVFAWDDPIPLLFVFWTNFISFFKRSLNFILRRVIPGYKK
jgi:predicted ATP-grasp superfamily ATP-dependent carboligase